MLAERLRELGVTVERGLELTSLDQDADGVRVSLRDTAGTTETVSAGWVVGADGSHSTVRELVGTRLEGSFVGERFVLGDVEARHELDPATMYTHFSPDGPLLIFPMLGSRLRVICQVRNGAAAPPTLAGLQRIVDDRAGDIDLLSAHWLTEFEIHHAQVPQYRHGRVFLAGDAAHVHSPAGGQGMNTGMQDAHNLAWKLAVAIRTGGGDRLLDSYHDERHPVAARVIDFTTRITDIGTLEGAMARRFRNTVMHAVAGIGPVRHLVADQVEETSLSYRQSPAVVDDHAPRRARVHAGDHAPYVANAAAGGRLRELLAATTEHVVLTFSDVAPGAVGVRIANGTVPPPPGSTTSWWIPTARCRPATGCPKEGPRSSVRTAISAWWADPTPTWPATSTVSPPDRRQRFGFTSGNRIVSRMLSPVRFITSRSTPRPMPPVGGMPYSRAARKSSSTCIASASPAAASRDWATSRSRWSIGSTSSEYAVPCSAAKIDQVPLLGQPRVVAVLPGQGRVLLGEVGVEDRRRGLPLAELAVDLLQHEAPRGSRSSSSPIRSAWRSSSSHRGVGGDLLAEASETAWQIVFTGQSPDRSYSTTLPSASARRATGSP